MKLFGKKWFWIATAVCMLAAALIVRNAAREVSVKVYEVKREDLAITVTATSTGTIKADQEVKLTVRRSGTIRRLLVEEGSVVNRGDLIAEFETDEVGQKLTIASAALQRMEATLQSLKLGLQAYRTDADASVKKTSSIVAEAESRLKRFNELMAKGYISQLDLESLQREYDVARANHASALAAQSQAEAKEREIQAQEAAVNQAGNELDLARLQFEYSFIRAPLRGVVTARPVKVGETVPVGALVATVVSPDSLYVEAFIDEADVGKVKIGQPVHVGFDAFTGSLFKGKVSMISPVVLGGKQEARTFEVRVRLTERNVPVKPGMSADVEVVVDNVRDIMGVPSQAIFERPEGRFVYVVRGGKAVPVPVRTGHFTWNVTEVIEGLREGDTVIVNLDAAGLEEGARVKVLKSEK